MSRNILFLLLGLIVVLLTYCKSAKYDDIGQSVKRPNIILIMADDMGYADIGCYGSEVNTPNLDKLAENGLRFTQFYNTARCCPTRASLLTGLHPHQAGIGHMVHPRDEKGAYQGDLNNHCMTIAQVLKEANYATFMTGKWHVTPLKKGDLNTSKHNWPLQRGFDQFFGTIHGAGSFFDPNSLTSGNDFIVPGKDFYYTDAISDTAVQFIKNHTLESPFFMYVAYTAAHWPMHALPKDIAKYQGRYNKGWEELREERIAKMRSLGLIKPEWEISKPYPGESWEKQEMKEWHAACMEVYAAMIDNMDQGIGRIVKTLEEKGELENTLIFYLQDNGACAENYGFGRQNMAEFPKDDFQPMASDELQFEMEPKYSREGKRVRVGKGVMPGPADTYIGYAKDWANVGNTPFRMFKHWVHEGGISSPLIVHWPAAIKDQGALREQPSQIIDIMATCVDVAGAQYPEQFGGNSIIPMQGVSLKPAFANQSLKRDTLYWEHEGNRAIRIGKWKLVSKAYSWHSEHDGTSLLSKEHWELFDMELDRTENNDLSAQHSEMVKGMSEAWFSWANRAKVLPKPMKAMNRPDWAKDSEAVKY